MIDVRGLGGFLLAHQGGWDEALFAVGPLLAFGALLAVANRRASRAPNPPRDPPADADASS